MFRMLVRFVFLVLTVSGLSTQDKATRQIHGGQTQGGASSDDPVTSWIEQAKREKPNVLFLIVDDLRPKLGCYGDGNMITPNMDHLGSLGVRFGRAYVQQALCGPSRTSFLTGRRPDTTHVFELSDYWRRVAGNFTTIPQYFKQHGYASHGIGKIFHPGSSSGGDFDAPYSWTDHFDSGHGTLHVGGPDNAIHPVDETGGILQDTAVADSAIDWLGRHQSHGNQPFFLAVGFHKPHLPWVYPREYNSLYPLSNLRLAEHRHKPDHIPDYAWTTCPGLIGRDDLSQLHLSEPEYYIPDNWQLKIRQAYSASVSYIDAQVGRVLHALHLKGFSQNTVIILLGDHGWQLGENAEWCKQTNFELAVRIPLILYVPGVTAHAHNFPFFDPLAPESANRTFANGPYHSTDELVEAVDLFATLAELTGLPVPHTCPNNPMNVETCTEGTSLVPLVRMARADAQHTGFTTKWKDAAYSQYARGLSGDHTTMGYTIRTDRYRYTEWVAYDTHHYTADFDTVKGRELYDHNNDPEEANNLAEDPGHSDTVRQLSNKLRAGWRQTLQNYNGH